VRRHDYLPFGEENVYNAAGGSRTAANGYVADGVRQQFVGYERDNETGLDFAQARYYANVQGRFTSPDPTLLSVNGFNPQTWNRYSYVMNNPLAYADPLGLWALEAYEIYKTNKDGSDKLDKNGNKILDRIGVRAIKTQKDDDGASLAKQLGLTGKDADKFAAKIGDGDNIRLSQQGGEVGRIFGVVESLLGDQKKHEAQGRSLGPSNGTYADCSSTSCKIAFPSEDINGSNWSVFKADELISGRRLKSVSADALSIGDIVRYAIGTGNTPAHFTTFIFRDDSGVPLVFSRSGEGGVFEYGSAYSRRFQNDTYGTIRGIGKDPTGFYSRGR
jgi:RHS repeat-associated protein